MTNAIKIDDMVPLDKTSLEILKLISLFLANKTEDYVNYTLIAQTLDLDRDTVRKSVNRMIERKVLRKEGGKLSILNAVKISEL